MMMQTLFVVNVLLIIIYKTLVKYVVKMENIGIMQIQLAKV